MCSTGRSGNEMSFFSFGNKKMKQKDLIASLEADKDSLQRADDESKKQIHEMKESVTDLQKSINRMTIENKELKVKLDREEPYDKVFNERQDLIQNNSIQASKIKELENDISELNAKVESVTSDKDKLMSELATSRKNNNAVSVEFQRELSKASNLTRKRDELEGRIEEIDDEKRSVETELEKIKDDFTKLQDEYAAFKKEVAENEENEKSKQKALITSLTVELSEHRRKIENLQLESEALKSENEALFKANESKSGDIIQFRKEMTEIKNEVQEEKEKYSKLKHEWEERERTEFIMVSKTPTKRQRSLTYKSIKEDDSEDEHVLSVTESARAEAEALRQKELAYKKKIGQLKTDKEELFRSGTNLFVENKSLKARYEDLLGERQKLLKSENPLKRKVRDQQEEIMKLKKSIDDMYYQNTTIKIDEESARQKAYVVVMGNEMVKQLEREKSALIRRVKFLERENNDIESRVNELERQSADLIKYTQKYDKHSTFPSIKSRSDLDRRPYVAPPDSGHSYYSDTQQSIPMRSYNEYHGDRRQTPQQSGKTPDYLQGAKPRSYGSATTAKVDLPMLRSQQSHSTSRVSLNRLASDVRSYNQSPGPPTSSDRVRQTPPRQTPYSHVSLG